MADPNPAPRYQFTVWLAPFPKLRARHRVRGRRGRKWVVQTYTPLKGRRAEGLLRDEVLHALEGERPELTGALALRITAYLAYPTAMALWRRALAWPTSTPDVDNLAKLAMDALTAAGVWKDDAQVVSLVTRKRYVEAIDARWEISLRWVGPSPADLQRPEVLVA